MQLCYTLQVSHELNTAKKQRTLTDEDKAIF
jgi:hypothetical protein